MGAGFFAPLMNELWGGDCCCELLQRRFVRQSARDKVNKHPLAGVDRPCAKVARRLLPRNTAIARHWGACPGQL